MADINYAFGHRPYVLPVEDIKKVTTFDTCAPKKWQPEVGSMAHVMRPFKVYKDNGNGTMEVHDCNGNSLTASKEELFNYLIDNQTEYKMKAMKDAVLAVAKNLLKANNKVTTLEIKTELRRDYPYYFWDQQTVSDFMSQLAGDGIFDFTDNGIYREYRNSGTSVTPVVASKTVTQPKTLTGAIRTGFRPRKVTPAPVAQVVAKKRGRPRKSSTLNRAQALALASNPSFQSVTFNDGTVVNKQDIRRQKKSPYGYLTVSKLYKITEITAAGVTYQVK